MRDPDLSGLCTWNQLQSYLSLTDYWRFCWLARQNKFLLDLAFNGSTVTWGQNCNVTASGCLLAPPFPPECCSRWLSNPQAFLMKCRNCKSVFFFFSSLFFLSPSNCSPKDWLHDIKESFLVAQLVSKRHILPEHQACAGEASKDLGTAAGGALFEALVVRMCHVPGLPPTPRENLCLAAHRWFLTSYLPWELQMCSYGMEAAAWKKWSSNKIFEHLGPVTIFSKPVLVKSSL